MFALARRTPMRTVLWLAFFAAILAAWWVLFSMAKMSGVDWLGRPVGMNMMSMTGFAALFAMWSIMMAAMMLPTMVPTLRAYEDLMQSANGTRAGWTGVLLGYFAVWVGFAALITVVQLVLLRFGWVDGLGTATSGWITAGLLIAVGAFQFSRLKDVCHGVCHAPTMYFLGHWRTGTVGGLRMGLNLAWMGLATVFMIFEKLPQVGHHLLKPAGVVLIGAGVFIAAQAAGLTG